MRLLRTAVLCHVALVSTTSIVCADSALTITQVVSATISTNGNLISAQQMARADQFKAKSVGAWDDPMFMIGVNNVPTNFDFRMDPMTMTMFGLSQTIPLAGQKGLSSKAAHKSAESARAMAEMTAVELTFSARMAFHEFAYAQQMLREMRKQRSVYSDMAETATNRFRIGLGGQEDVTSAQAAAFRFESQIRKSEQEVTEAANELSALSGLAVDETAAVALDSSVALPPSDSIWIAQAEASYPELKKLSAQREASEFGAASARRMRWPMLTLSASYGVRRDGPATHGGTEKRDNMVSFGAGISLPIFAGKRDGNMAHSMQLMGLSATAELTQLQREISSELKTLHAKATRLQQSIAGYEHDVIPASDQAYQGALASYKSGRLTLGELLMFAMPPIDDRIELIQLRLDLATTLDQVLMYTTNPADLLPAANTEN